MHKTKSSTVGNLVFRGIFKGTLITLSFIATNDIEIKTPNFVVEHVTVVQFGCTIVRL